MTDKQPLNSTRVYRQPLNYENAILIPKLRELSMWRDTDVKLYMSGVKTLSILLPKNLREEAMKQYNGDTIKIDMTDDGKKDFDDLFIYILDLLYDAGLVFPRSTFIQGEL